MSVETLEAGPLAELPTRTEAPERDDDPEVGRLKIVATVPDVTVLDVLISKAPKPLPQEKPDSPLRLSCVVPVWAVGAPEFTVKFGPVTPSDPFRKVLVTWLMPLVASVIVSVGTACVWPPRSIRLPPVFVADVCKVSVAVERGLAGPSVTVADRMVVVPLYVLAPLSVKLPVLNVMAPSPVIGPLIVSELAAAPF